MPELAITIRADGVQLTPGTAAAISVEVRNLGTIVDRYRCELVGVDPSWYTVTPASMELFPQGDASSTRSDAPPSIGRFQVTLHPPRTSAAKAGPWPFGAKVTSEHDPSNRRVEEGSVVFLPFGSLDADLRPAVVSGRFGTNASLQLANRGNRPETVEISGTDRAARITFDVQPPRLTLAPGETRRNLTTRGIRLNDLVGRTFRIGSVTAEGLRLCEPCAYLQGQIGKPILEPLVHRAGLRARLLDDGELHVGDPIEVEPD